MFLIKGGYLGNFSQVVVLRGQPENGDTRQALLGKRLRKADCGERFIKSKGRPGK